MRSSPLVLTTWKARPFQTKRAGRPSVVSAVISTGLRRIEKTRWTQGRWPVDGTRRLRQGGGAAHGAFGKVAASRTAADDAIRAEPVGEALDKRSHVHGIRPPVIQGHLARDQGFCDACLEFHGLDAETGIETVKAVLQERGEPVGVAVGGSGAGGDSVRAAVHALQDEGELAYAQTRSGEFPGELGEQAVERRDDRCRIGDRFDEVPAHKMAFFCMLGRDRLMAFAQGLIESVEHDLTETPRQGPPGLAVETACAAQADTGKGGDGVGRQPERGYRQVGQDRALRVRRDDAPAGENGPRPRPRPACRQARSYG